MRVYSMVWSPTGGTKQVMALLSGAFQDVETVDFTAMSHALTGLTLSPEDVCLVGVPSFGGRVPAPAMEKLAELNGNGARAVAVAVYGNRDYEDTLLELKTQLEQCGFSVAAGVAAVAEHSILHQFGAGRPDEADAAELRSFAQQLRQKLSSEAYQPVTFPGHHPYRPYDGVPLHPSAGRRCNGCGLCARECPVGAIPASAPSSTDKAVCISCMRCISLCPRQARGVNALMRAASGMKLRSACRERKSNQLILPAGGL